MAFDNNLSNTIKFTDPNGTISIKQTSDSKKVSFQITDSGCGMSPKNADQSLRQILPRWSLPRLRRQRHEDDGGAAERIEASDLSLRTQRRGRHFEAASSLCSYRRLFGRKIRHPLENRLLGNVFPIVARRYAHLFFEHFREVIIVSNAYICGDILNTHRTGVK